MGKFETHLGEQSKIEIDGETYYLSPLGTEYLKDIMSIAKVALKGGEDDSAFIDSLDFTIITRLVDATLAESYPEEWRKDNKKLKQWGLRNAMTLFSKIIEINVAKPTGEEASKIEIIKAKLAHDANNRITGKTIQI